MCGGSAAVHSAKWSRSPEMIQADGRGWQAVGIETENLLSLVLFCFLERRIKLCKRPETFR